MAVVIARTADAGARGRGAGITIKSSRNLCGKNAVAPPRRHVIYSGGFGPTASSPEQN
jgi:hypothetical protein